MPATYVSGNESTSVVYVARVLRVVSGAEFKLKYGDSALGYVWSIAKPLAWFAVLFAVFGRVFKLQAGFEHYGVYLLIGIVLWTFFADSTNIAIWSFVANGSVLRKLAFPRIVLPIASTVTTSLTFAANSLVVVVFVLLDGVRPQWTWLLVPLPVALIYVFTVAVSLALATIHIRIRDARQVWELALQLLFFASPIFYPVGFLPPWAQPIAFANPLVAGMQSVRALVIPQKEAITAADVYGTPFGILIPIAVCAAFVAFAYLLFRREEPYLAERS